MSCLNFASICLISGLGIAQAQMKWDVRLDDGAGIIQDVHWTGSMAVAIGYTGDALTSPDGAAWTFRDSLSPGYYYSICRSSTGRLYAPGLGRYALSEDGITWKRGYDSLSLGFAVAMGDRLIGFSRGKVYKSTDDSTWVRLPMDTAKYLYQAAWNGKVLVAVGTDTGNAAGSVATSDGVHWEGRRLPQYTYFQRVVWAKDRFFAFGRGVMATSQDGLAWTDIPIGQMNVYDLVWTGSKFIASGDELISGRTMVSADGVKWRDVPQPDGKAYFYSLTWTGSKLIMAGMKLPGPTRFIVTADEADISVHTLPRNREAIAWEARAGLLTARLPGGDRLVRACLRNTAGMELRSAGPDARGALQMPLRGIARGVYVLELEGMKGMRSAPVLLAR